MSQTVITAEFEQWKAQQAVSGEAITLDEFVFANVPDLDTDAPIDRAEGLPDAALIVHRQAVSRTGVVNENGVVYSVVLGADTGDFAFNWIGLVNKASGTVAMIVHAPLQQKIKTTAGQQGNVLTRSFLLEFNGAQAETAINTPAETWQIDFTARMAGMDERQRLENIDIYGAGAFFDKGWLVVKSGAQYSVTKGVGYVAGLRAALAENQDITVTKKPVTVWLDVCWRGTLTSRWAVESKITVADSLADYEKDGVKHYVFALASIDADGNVTDLRPKGALSEQQAASDYLRKDKNLADVSDPAKALANIGGVSKSTTINGYPLSGNVAVTPADVFGGTVQIRPSTDLNTLTTPGLYFQPANADAASGKNYPEASAGSLIVTKHAGMSQIYIIYLTGVIYSRGLYNGAWSGWRRMASTTGDTFNGEIKLNGMNCLRLYNGDYGLIMRRSENNFYMIPTPQGQAANGDISGSLRPFMIELANGKVTMNNGVTVGQFLIVNGNVNINGQIIPSNWSNLDARYQLKTGTVQQVRLGAAKDVSNGNGNLADQSGYVVTMGGDFGSDNGYYRLRPIQYLINGTWHNAVSA
jgi:hypothetical protein